MKITIIAEEELAVAALDAVGDFCKESNKYDGTNIELVVQNNDNEFYVIIKGDTEAE